MFSCLIEFWCRLDVSEQLLRSEKRNYIHGERTGLLKRVGMLVYYMLVVLCKPLTDYDSFSFRNTCAKYT